MSKSYFKCVRDYLKDHSLADLRREHGVRYNIREHLITLTYDQFEASNSDRIACNCRGAVITKPNGDYRIDENAPFGELRLLAFPFTRFFNYGQNDHDIFLPKAVYEKYDGTCIIFYWDPFCEMWQVGTRSVPDGSNIASSFSPGLAEAGRTFRELFEKAVQDSTKFSSIEDLGNSLDKNVTYIFELMTPENQVVVHHNEYKIVLIGARHIFTEEEMYVNNFNNLSIAVPDNILWSISPIMNPGTTVSEFYEYLVSMAEKRDPTKHEGFVVVGENFQRLKIKSSAYVRHNRIHDLTHYDIIDSIVAGEIDDVLPLAPEHIKQKIQIIENKLQRWVQSINEQLSKFQWNGHSDRKDFALYVRNNAQGLAPIHGHIFRAFSEGKTIHEVQEVLSSGKVSSKKIWEWIQ